MSNVAYPDDNPKTVLGLAKPALRAIPGVALFKLGQAMSDGLRKYGLYNWRDKRVTASTYFDAAMRHLWAWWDGENVAADSGVDHLAHAMACLAIVLDADSVGKLNDDRGPAGALAAFLAEKTKKTDGVATPVAAVSPSPIASSILIGPRYVRCIQGSNLLRKGRIYRTDPPDSAAKGFVCPDEANLKGWAFSAHRFEPATEAEYVQQMLADTPG